MKSPQTRRACASVLATLMLTLTVGCRSAVEPDASIPIEFTYALAGAPGAPAGTTTPPTLSADADQLVLLGRLGAEVPCYTIRAAAVAIDTIVRVRILLDRRSTGCVDSITEWAYRLEAPRPTNSRRLVLEYATRTNGTTTPYTTVHEATLPP